MPPTWLNLLLCAMCFALGGFAAWRGHYAAAMCAMFGALMAALPVALRLTVGE